MLSLVARFKVKWAIQYQSNKEEFSSIILQLDLTN
jgi:hypothetical protein